MDKNIRVVPKKKTNTIHRAHDIYSVLSWTVDIEESQMLFDQQKSNTVIVSVGRISSDVAAKRHAEATKHYVMVMSFLLCREQRNI